MKYEVGMIVRIYGTRFHEVLSIVGSLVFTSDTWSLDDSNEEKAHCRRKSGNWNTVYDLEDAEATIVTPEEAGLPPEKKERWRPELLHEFFYVSMVGVPNCAVWNNGGFCQALYERGNVHRTEEEAIEWDKKRMIKDE